MTNDIILKYNKLLENLSNELDISESRFKQAEDRYEAVGKWLRREDSTVAEHRPDIYTQGSFRLGTVIKPITDAEKYDIDLVCVLDLTKNRTSQKQLKEMVGYEIKNYATSNNMQSAPENGKRCWTLNYADGAQFHMDILPSLPDGDSFRLFLENKGFSTIWTELAIAITDKTHHNYNQIADDWLRSNPKGYAEWFKERMKVQFNAQRKVLAEAIRANIEDVPEYKVKTPLQRVIQILKRHRDIMFDKDMDDKPISIIITTLAAHSYNNESDLLDALQNIVNGMPRYIEDRDGVSYVPNPVNPLENFADKWHPEKHPQREVKFRQWLNQVRTDIDTALQATELHNIIETLKPRFGDRLVNKAAANVFPARDGSVSAAAAAVPHISISKPSKPWGA